jgi:hypothetical protein
MRMLFPTIIIFAVDDSRLLRMKLKIALFKPVLQHLFQQPSFGFVPTVYHPIISITAKWNLWIIPFHPFVKHIVKEKIGKQGTNHSSLRSPFRPLYSYPLFPLKWSLQPSLNL